MMANSIVLSLCKQILGSCLLSCSDSLPVLEEEARVESSVWLPVWHELRVARAQPIGSDPFYLDAQGVSSLGLAEPIDRRNHASHGHRAPGRRSGGGWKLCKAWLDGLPKQTTKAGIYVDSRTIGVDAGACKARIDHVVRAGAVGGRGQWAQKVFPWLCRLHNRLFLGILDLDLSTVHIFLA